MKHYAIWNKIDPIITPIGEVFTAEQWMNRYPVAKLPNITILCGAGELNGSFFGTLGQMVQMYEERGVDFSECITPEEKLALIEAFEEAEEAAAQEAEKAAAANAAANEEMNAMSLASIAASMEYQNMLTLDDVEE